MPPGGSYLPSNALYVPVPRWSGIDSEVDGEVDGESAAKAGQAAARQEVENKWSAVFGDGAPG